MAKYCAEKFEDSGGVEKRVCWECTKHVHDASLITTIEKKLGARFGGKWQVRANSYQSNLSTCPQGSIDYHTL